MYRILYLPDVGNIKNKTFNLPPLRLKPPVQTAQRINHSMTYDNFTIKAQEAILQAQQIAAGYEQQSVDSSHLLKGILNADDSVTDFLLKKTGVNMARFPDEFVQFLFKTGHVHARFFQ